MKLDNNEINEMKNIVLRYSNLHSEFEETQKQLEIISKKKDLLLESLETVHKEELNFYEKLKQKYGEGKLDFNSLEYKSV